jgi:transcriptional regulator with XRE-family HTH domain
MLLQDRVKRVIDTLGVKQKAFTEAIGCSDCTFSRWLNDKCDISWQKERKIEQLVTKYEILL